MNSEFGSWKLEGGGRKDRIVVSYENKIIKSKIVMSDSHQQSPMFDYQPALPISNGKTFMWLFLSTEIMFFAALIGTYIVLRFGAISNASGLTPPRWLWRRVRF